MITKSIRLTDDEAQELGTLARDSGEVEAVILKRAALRGLREDRVDRAVLTYLRGEGTDHAANVANVPRARFIELLAEKGITVLDQPSSLPDELDVIARLSSDRHLSQTATGLRDSRRAGTSPGRRGRR